MLFLAFLSDDGTCEVRGTFKEIATFLNRFEADAGIAKELAGNLESGGFLWRGDGGELSLVWDVAHQIEKRRFVANFFIGLQVAASHLAERAARPLILVKVAQHVEGKSVRRLSRGQHVGDS